MGGFRMQGGPSVSPAFRLLYPRALAMEPSSPAKQRPRKTPHPPTAGAPNKRRVLAEAITTITTI